jgi:hypothetical protein
MANSFAEGSSFWSMLLSTEYVGANEVKEADCACTVDSIDIIVSLTVFRYI